MTNGLQMKKRILIISSDSRGLVEIKKELRDTFEINIAATGDNAASILETYETDAAVIYVNDDGGNAISEFALFFERLGQKHIPVLFMVKSGSEDMSSAAFAMGAADYFVKGDTNGSEWIRRLNTHIGVDENMSEESEISKDSLEGKTVLIAEDVVLNQEIIAKILSPAKGLIIEFAGNGIEAVEKLKADSDRYDIVFMDIHMPEMDGQSAAIEIRKLNNKAAREIPIIAMTASEAEDEIAGYMEAGMNDYMKKPMNFEDFKKMLMKYCA